jgi:hypothetical protein
MEDGEVHGKVKLRRVLGKLWNLEDDRIKMVQGHV